jgi:predicted amidohydrolase YtcJ
VLIRNAEVAGRRVDVHLENGRIAAIRESVQDGAAGVGGESSATPVGTQVPSQQIDARGGALLPGLHDHHIHLFSLAAARASIFCGPPQIGEPRQLRSQLQSAAKAAGNSGWLRGIGYHESVAGNIDRDWLDGVLDDQPIRIQHRSGRLWILNSAALARLGELSDSPLESIRGRFTGRLYDADVWLRGRLNGQYPSIAELCSTLVGYGLTGLTDASVSNDPRVLQHLQQEATRGHLPLRLLLMGDASLSAVVGAATIEVGALKLHLHDHALPDLHGTARAIAQAHEAGRVAAFHCVTEAELAFAIAALDEAGVKSGDRIEHAASTSPALVSAVAERGLTVVTQPHFILERGDQYRRDIPLAEQAWLYRCATWLSTGVALGGGSDAPYGSANPWVAMQAAVERSTRDGALMAEEERLTPEQALALYLSPAHTPGMHPRRVAVGEPADLCLLDRPWSRARLRLSDVRVAATVRAGKCVWSAISR